MSFPFKRRAPYITRAGSSDKNERVRYRGRTNLSHFCNYCGAQTVYLESFRARYCNACGIAEEDSDELKAQLEFEKQQQEATYEMADGSAIYSPGLYTPSNIRKGKTAAIGSGKGHTVNLKNAITDKLRYRDGRTREMDAIFRSQDKQLEANGRRILSDTVELKRSDDIRSSDELKAEKAGTVGLKGAGQYNPATGRRTRLSF